MTKKLKLAILLFALIFIVGAAFAATNGVLVFGGTVRINSATTVPGDMRLEFVSVGTYLEPPNEKLNLTYEIISTEEGRKFLSFDIHFSVSDMSSWVLAGSRSPIWVEIKNTGAVPVRFLGFDFTESDNSYMNIVVFWDPIAPPDDLSGWDIDGHIGVRQGIESGLNSSMPLLPGRIAWGSFHFRPDYDRIYEILTSQNSYTFNYRIELLYERAD